VLKLKAKTMKALIFCLMILGYTGVSKSTSNYSKAGGVIMLAVDPANSTINWKAEKPTGTHSGVVRIQSGSLKLFCKQLNAGSIIIDMRTLNVTDLAASDKQKLENSLKGDNFFDTGRYPLAKLDIVSVNYKSPSSYSVTVTANLALHGVTKKVTFPATISKNTGEQFSAQADIMINPRDWDIATKNTKSDNLTYSDFQLHFSLNATKVSV
jgi:polyisoprenoid-binding protein YceI